MKLSSGTGEQSNRRSLSARAIYSLRRSFFLSFAIFGFLLIVAGFTLELLWMIGMSLEDGVIAGMLGIWGMTALLIGTVGYGTLRYMRDY